MLSFQDYTTPEFLFCELPIKNGSFHDHRIWVYHPGSLSLIEFVALDDLEIHSFKGPQKKFTFFEENYLGVFVENNCPATDQDENELLQKAWEFIRDYFAWEDNNILDDQEG